MDIYESLYLARENKFDYYRGKVDAIVKYSRMNIFDFKDMFENLCSMPNIPKRISKIEHLLYYDFDINTLFSERKNALFITLDAETTSYLIHRGIKINHLNYLRQNALFYCHDKEEMRKIMCLVKSGIDVFIEDKYNQNLFFNECDIEILEYYLSLGLDINHEDYNGNIPFFYFKSDEKLKFFIQNKSKINHRNKRGQTAIQYVLETDYWNAKYYFNKGIDLSIRDNNDRSVVDYINRLPDEDIRESYLKEFSKYERNRILPNDKCFNDNIFRKKKRL